MSDHTISTSRLHLRRWRKTDEDAFAAMNSDPEVMHDLGGPIDRSASNLKLERYATSFDRHGYGRWVITSRQNEFLGYAGVMRRDDDHPLGIHDEIGWRLVRSAWGRGYASEAASAALSDTFARTNLSEIVSYTSPDNLRSQAVMQRLCLKRDPSRDFTHGYDPNRPWRGLVWVAKRRS